MSDVIEKSAANPIDASTPYCASSNPTSTFINNRIASSLAGVLKSTV